METSSLIDVLRAQGTLLGDAAARTELTAPVPTCPGWTVRDLLLHVGGVHRWAATVVREHCADPIDLEQPYDIVATLPADDALLDWYRDGHAGLVATLAEAPADLDCWAFLPAPTPLAFWARRQAHETTIHRVDAEAASGRARLGLPPEAAADGIDELLTCFVSGRSRRLRGKPERTLLVHATDVDTRWLLRIGADLPHVDRVGPDTTADASVAGPAATLFPALWNRVPWDDLDTTGGTPAQLADRWGSDVHVRWS